MRTSDVEFCSFPSCNRRAKAKGLCNGHYQQRVAGKGLSPLQVKKRRDGTTRGDDTCFFAGCEHPVSCWGLCDGHYQQWLNRRTLTPLQSIQHHCDVVGCDKPHDALGLCNYHYNKKRKYGDPLARGRLEPSVVEVREGNLVVVLDGARAQGRTSLVSQEDKKLVEAHRWNINAGGYAITKIEGKRVLMHRLILGLGPDDPRQGDHINGDRLDNRRENLRIVTFEQQMQNKKPWGKSGHRNVFWEETKGLWRVIVIKDGKRHYGGRHGALEDALAAAAELRDKLLTHHNDDRCST